MPVRPQFHDVMRSVAHARIDMQTLQLEVISDMQNGYRPTYRGYPWNNDTFAALENAAHAIQVAFDWLKVVQFPEVDSRRREAQIGSTLLEAPDSRAIPAESGG